MEPALIKVRNGQAVSIEILDEKYKAAPPEEAIRGYRQIDTLEKMFDYIQKTLDGKSEVLVRYDKDFGYPGNVTFYKNESDEYQIMTIWKFEIVTNE